MQTTHTWENILVWPCRLFLINVLAVSMVWIPQLNLLSIMKTMMKASLMVNILIFRNVSSLPMNLQKKSENWTLVQ